MFFPLTFNSFLPRDQGDTTNSRNSCLPVEAFFGFIFPAFILLAFICSASPLAQFPQCLSRIRFLRINNVLHPSIAKWLSMRTIRREGSLSAVIAR